jgi:glycolate oxidase FAD binding subunit
MSDDHPTAGAQHLAASAGGTIPAPIAGACQTVRHATPADAIAGVQPSLVAAPSSTQECSALLRAASELGLAVIPRGTGSRMHWGNPPERCDLVIELTRMDQVIEHAAGDLVATVQAGVTLERLAGVLREAGQRLALDPPRTELPAAAGDEPVPRRTRGTVGGVLATGAAGPLRLRYGSGRDLLIGITVVRADGTVAKSGGKVVKNVAGYDLGKLFAGSRGTLGLITQATFRLHPIPARTAIVTATCPDPADAARVLALALDSPLAPVSAELHWATAGEPIEIAVAVEGDEAGVTDRADALAELMTGRSLRMPVCGQVPGGLPDLIPLPPPPPWWGAGAPAQSAGTVIQVAFWPGELARVLGAIRAAAADTGLDPGVGGSAGAGVLHIAVPADREPAAVASFVDALRGTVTAHSARSAPGTNSAGSASGTHTARSASGTHSAGSAPGTHSARSAPARASVLVLHAPPAVGALTDLFGPVPSLPLMRAVKHQFDPRRLLSPGRFAGGI